jgi:hypothetical protein
MVKRNGRGNDMGMGIVPWPVALLAEGKRGLFRFLVQLPLYLAASGLRKMLGKK